MSQQSSNQNPKVDKNEELIFQPQNWENWRVKSLNSGNLERYSLPMSQPSSHPSNQVSKTKPKQEEYSSQKYVPKITKINRSIFCIYLYNSLTIFSYIDQAERERRRINSRLIKKIVDNIIMPHNVEWIYGDGVDNVYVASQSELLVLRVKAIINNQSNKEIQVKQIWKKNFDSIKSIVVTTSNIRKRCIILTKQAVFVYQINNINFQLMNQLPIQFSKESSGWKDISKINGISIVVQSLNVLYFIGTSIQLKADVKAKLGRQSKDKSEPTEKKCQSLYLTKLQLTNTSAKARVFIIDHIFQIGIFKTSRVHLVGPQTFLLSLFEEIIVIRRNFSKFVVWDNVSIVASKSNQKKGQLVLADKRIMVYTQSGQISAHELFFNFSKARLETPKIDSFRGNGNEEQMLYDALILEYKDQTYMKILFYFKQMEVYTPNKKIVTHHEQGTSSTNKNQIFFQIMCIQQTQPTDKLKELLYKNKSQEQISSFLKRFNIKELKYKKSEWEVSAKEEKEIQTLLLNIQDNQYIQSQLTKILKQKPHDLQFLIAIQKKQIERYRLMVASKILMYEQHSQNLNKRSSLQQNFAFNILSKCFLIKQLEQIKLAIQWLLQSKMLYQKLMYSMSFMSFKEYDFIEISKLRSTSLRQQIKLLGVKGYEKRLKYFLNSFKYLVLDDFKEILRFLIADLTESQLRIFFTKSFPFILPAYVQTQAEDRCKLWDDTFTQDQYQIQTIQSFKKQIEEEMLKLVPLVPAQLLRIPLKQGIQAFNYLFNQFITESWFNQNSYKQHSLLRHNIQQLKQSFQQLKNIEVCNIIIQLAYEKIHAKQYAENKVNFIMHALGKQKFFTADYIVNIQSRLEVYDFLQKKLRQDTKKYGHVKLKRKSAFIILPQPIYFEILFEQFYDHLIVDIKKIYQRKKKGLFLQNVRQYLDSSLPDLGKLIKFIEQFQANMDSDDVKNQVLTCICKLMKVTDIANSKLLIRKLIQMPLGLKKKNAQIKNKLIPQAKIACSINLIPLFAHFNLQQNYAQLLYQTQQLSFQQTKIFKQLIEKYVNSYKPNSPQPLKFQKSQFIDCPLPYQIDLCEVVDFLSILFYLHEILNYEFKQQQIFKYLIVGFIEIGKFQDLTHIVQDVFEFGKLFDDRQLIEKYENYRILNAYKVQNNVKKQFQTIMEEWIDYKYRWLINLKPEPIQQRQNEQQCFFSQQTIKKTFFSISSVLKILNYHSFNQNVELQISRISLFQNIKKISEPLLIIVLPHLVTAKEQYGSVSSFSFMFSLLQKIPNRELMFSISDRQQVLEYLSHFSLIQKQYQAVFHKKNKKGQEVLLGQLCRFNAEMILVLVNEGYPRMAGFLVIDLINSTYYYRDILFYFISRMIDIQKVGHKAIQKFVYQFMTIQNPQDLKKILSNFIVKHQLQSTAQPRLYENNIVMIFTEILKNSHLDEAFFFALRNLQVQTTQFQRIALEMNKFRQDHIIALTLLVTFIRATKEKIEGQTWPTFILFRRKINCLLKPSERMDVIKDIAIVMGQLQIDDLKAKIKSMSQLQLRRSSSTSNIEKSEKSSKQIKQNSQLPKLQQRGPQITKSIKKQSGFQKLKKSYQKYMISQNLNPWLAITTQEVYPTAIRLQKYPDYSVNERQSKQEYFKILPMIRQEESNQIKQLRRKLFDNQQKLKQIQAANRKLLDEDITPAITQAKKKVEKQYLSLVERKKQKLELEMLGAAQKKMKNSDHSSQLNIDLQSQADLQKLDQKQKQKLAENKTTYRSKIVQQTENLLAQLRERRKKVRQQTTVTFADERQEKKQENDNKSSISARSGYRPNFLSQDFVKQQMKGSMILGGSKNGDQIPSKDKKYDVRVSLVGSSREDLRQRLDLIKDNNLKSLTINKLMADKNGDFYVPRWEQKVPMRQQFEQLLQDKPKNSSQYIEKAKKQLAEEIRKSQKQKLQKQKSKKITSQQFVQKHKPLNEPVVGELIQKISLMQNSPKICTEMIKNIYTQIKEIKNFIQICKDLLIVNQSASQYIEHKAVKIVQESLRVKVSVQFKQIFPPHFFTSIHNVSMRDYYLIAYDMLRPNITKLMQQPNYNINALGMMIRFGFGSDNTYYYKVYQDYIHALLQNYQAKSQLIFVQKDIMQLAEKLRSIYNNLNPSNKKLKFEQLVQEIAQPEKRKALVKALVNNLENKSSMINKQSYEQFRLVLAKLESAAS